MHFGKVKKNTLLKKCKSPLKNKTKKKKQNKKQNKQNKKQNYTKQTKMEGMMVFIVQCPL